MIIDSQMEEALALYMTRYPRFHVSRPKEIQVSFTRDSIDGSSFEGTLINISRHGLKARIDQPLEDNELVTIHLTFADQTIVKSAHVQWAKWYSDGKCDVGCRLQDQFSWETMGELFLTDVISPSEESSDELTGELI